MLTPTNAVFHLLSHGLLSRAEVVDGVVEVTDASRRNRNFRVTSTGSTAWLVKQGASPHAETTIAHEARIYELLDAAPTSLRRYLPRTSHYDDATGVLSIALLPDPLPLGNYHDIKKAFPAHVGRSLGMALAALHGYRTKNPEVWGAGEPPSILGLHRPPLDVLVHYSGANVMVTRMVQHSSEFGERLEALAGSWQPEVTLHNDVKWDNVVMSREGRGRRTLRIVDWELADLGDRGWDVGSVFAAYLTTWVTSIPVTGEEPPSGYSELARYPLSDMGPAMGAFWSSYCAHSQLDGLEAAELLVRSAQFAAARLAQYAFEHCQFASQVTGNVVLLLQLALNVLRRPLEAGRHLFAVSP